MHAVDINERAFLFACRVIELSERLHKAGAVARHAGLQLLGSGTSIGANLEEARAGQTKPDFVSKVSIALKEARETKYWLRLIDAGGLAQNENLAADIREADELIAILTAIVKRARESPSRGS
jgi:four helix bundle protein